MQKQKPLLLFITGWAHGTETLQPMADALANDFETQVLTGAQVLATRELPNADAIVTGSMGGLLAMELLPESCRKLVLISSTAKFCTDENYPCGTPEKILRRMIRRFADDPAAVLEEFFKNVYYPDTSPADIPATDTSNQLIEGLEYLRASDLREKVPAINIPVLLLHGSEDRIIPLAAADWLHAHLPNSQLKVFESAGHALPASHFNKIVDEILAFMQK